MFVSLVNRLSHGDFEMKSARRFHAALILWSSHPEREYHTCTKGAWAKSFTLVREIVNEIPSEVRVGPEGLWLKVQVGICIASLHHRIGIGPTTALKSERFKNHRRFICTHMHTYSH